MPSLHSLHWFSVFFKIFINILHLHNFNGYCTETCWTAYRISTHQNRAVVPAAWTCWGRMQRLVGVRERIDEGVGSRWVYARVLEKSTQYWLLCHWCTQPPWSLQLTPEGIVKYGSRNEVAHGEKTPITPPSIPKSTEKAEQVLTAAP